MSSIQTDPGQFFNRPILNSPNRRPSMHWELDESGQPTQQVLDYRRPADFVTPIPKPKKRRSADEVTMTFDVGDGVSTERQQYDTRSIINQVRGLVEEWRAQKNQALWQVTPETARLLHHWRHHEFSGVRGGLPTKDKTGVWPAAKVWRLFSEDSEGAKITSEQHEKLKGHGIWIWKEGTIEDTLGIMDKGEDVIQQLEQDLPTLDAPSMGDRFPAVAEFLGWLGK